MPEGSTTPDLIEMTRRIYETADAGDVDTMMRLFHPDAVWDEPNGEMETFEGASAVRRFVEDWQGFYEEYEANMEEVLDFGNGVTFAVSIQTGRPIGSTGELRIRFAASTHGRRA